jgi:hypothetical protein
VTKEIKIRIRKWYLFKFGTDTIPYILDLSNEEVNDDEIALCIQEQVYSKEESKSIQPLKEAHGEKR